MIWNVQLKLERPDEFKKDDESWFDEKHIKSEIITWLEDLDYTVTDVKIIRKETSNGSKSIYNKRTIKGKYDSEAGKV